MGVAVRQSRNLLGQEASLGGREVLLPCLQSVQQKGRGTLDSAHCEQGVLVLAELSP